MYDSVGKLQRKQEHQADFVFIMASVHASPVNFNSLQTRDGNRTEPEPNTPNSNPILRPLRTERNEPKEFDDRTRTEPKYQVERTEPHSNAP